MVRFKGGLMISQTIKNKIDDYIVETYDEFAATSDDETLEDQSPPFNNLDYIKGLVTGIVLEYYTQKDGNMYPELYQYIVDRVQTVIITEGYTIGMEYMARALSKPKPDNKLVFDRAQVLKMIGANERSDKKGYLLVADHGIYLMNRSDRERVIVYANGYDPDKNPDWYEAKHAISPDDFGNEILKGRVGRDLISGFIAKSASDLMIELTDDSILLSYTPTKKG